MALLLGGQRNQDWINRGARERAFTRFAAAGFFALLGVVVFETAALVYVGSLPREKAVVVAQQRDGSYQPYAENVTPNQAGIMMLLGNWVAAWRLGSNDARSLPARQVAALIPGPGDVLDQVKAYNQSIADGGFRVAPIVRPPTCSAFECEVDWDETVSSADRRFAHSMRAYVTVGFDDPHVALHNDPLTNPFGMYIKTLRVAEIK